MLEVFWRWGCSPDVEPKQKKPGFAVAQKFENIVKLYGTSYSAEHIAIARESTLAKMEEMIARDPSGESKRGAALSYFESTLSAKLRKLRQQEHDDRVAAKTVETEAEIKVDGARRADEMKLGALEIRLEAGNQAAVKRIESGAHVNSKATAASAPMTAERFNDDDKKIRRSRNLDKRRRCQHGA